MASNFGTAFTQAILASERRRLGLPSREEMEAKRVAEARAAAESASGLETADLTREKLRGDIATQPELTRLRSEAALATAEAARARAERDPQPTGPAAITGMNPVQFEEYVKRQKAVADATRDPNRPAAGGLSPASEAAILNRLQVQLDKSMAPGRELKRQYSVMQSGLNAARKGDLAAGSQAILVTFQKILDPLSVVRESEYARSAAGQSLLSRIQGAYEKLAQGGAGVPVAELEKFAAMAAEMVAGSQTFEKQTRSRALSTARRYGIPEDVLFGDESNETATTPTAPPASGPTTPNTRVRFNPQTGQLE